MKYTVEYCKNNKVAIKVNSEKELKELYTYFPGFKHYQVYHPNSAYTFDDRFESGSVEWGRSNMKFWNEFNYEIITFQEFMQNQTKKLEEYIVKCETKEESQLAMNFIKDNPFELDNYWKYVINSKIKGTGHTLWNYIPENCKNLPILTFQQFREQIMNTKKIIGYLAPIDLFKGRIKKGDLFSEKSKEGFMMYNKNHMTSGVATEIVMTWEAVFEEEFKEGDFVYVIKSQLGSFGAENKIGKLTKSVNNQGLTNEEKKFKEKFNVIIEGGVWNIGQAEVRKATQQEIDSLFIKTLTLSNGKKVYIRKGVITAQNETISCESLSYLLRGSKSKINSWEIQMTDATYEIGCWENVKLADIQNIIKEAERQKIGRAHV